MKPILFNTDMARAISDCRKTMTRRVLKHQPKYAAMTAAGLITSENPITIEDGLVVTKNGDVTTWDKLPYRTGDILYVRETWQEVYETEYADDGNEVNIRDAITNWDQIFKVSAGLSRDHSPVGSESRMKYYVFKADDPKFSTDSPWDKGLRWRPSIHMPKEAARLFLRVKAVRVERMQDITVDDILREGVFADDPPPICQEDVPSFPEGFHAWSEAQRNDWFKSTARARYIGWCEYADKLIRKFQDVWNSTIKPADRALYGWGANPWVWVIEFERINKEEITTVVS